MRAVIYDRASASIDGHPVVIGPEQDAYTAIIAHARQVAAEANTAVVVEADDRSRGALDRFSVTADGQVQVAPPMPTPNGAVRTVAPHPAPTIPHTAPPPALSGRTTPGILPLSFVTVTQPAPQRGWRKAVHSVSGGKINPGLSAAERHYNELIAQVRTRATRPTTIAVMCLKGGIGKTSTTAGVGLTLARHRGDRVLALDANPDAGDLYERTCGDAAPATLTDLADRLDEIHGAADLSRFTGIADRLAVIAGDQEPTVSESLSAADFVGALKAIHHFYNVVLVDCGTGVTHPSMSGILGNADGLIIAGGYAVSGARRAHSTLQWLHEHGYEHLARAATVVLTQTAAVSSAVNTQAIEEALAHLSARVITVPHDQQVADGAAIDLDSIAEPTRTAYLTVAASVAQRFQ